MEKYLLIEFNDNFVFIGQNNTSQIITNHTLLSHAYHNIFTVQLHSCDLLDEFDCYVN